MLYLISYKLYNQNEEVYTGFFDAIGNLGDSLMLYDGCYFVDSHHTAQGIRRDLAGHVGSSDRFIVTRVYRNHSAGKLSQVQKEFLKQYIGADPFPPEKKGESYSF